jgi:DNA modification methylase
MIQLMHGDCLIEMNKIPDGSVDMILADLPYGTTACKWDVVIPFEPLWEHYWRVLKPNGAVVLFASQPFTSLLGVSQIQYLKYSWVWDKHHATGHLNAKKRPMKRCEDILVFYRNQPTYNAQDLIFSPKKMTNSDSHCQREKGCETSTVEGRLRKDYMQEFTGWPRNLISFKSANGNKDHPTQKPVALLEYLIKTYTNENETVLDNCMGSGSTGVACINTNRNFIGLEKDINYYNIAIERIKKSETE